MTSQIKAIIKNVLCNDGTGWVLTKIFGQSIPDIRWKGFRFQLPRAGVSNTNKAAIFWGFYESAEIRFIQKYLRGNLDVVEMGGSLGIVSAHIVSKLNPGRKIVTVEANPFLIDNINANLKKFAKEGTGYKTINCAIQYSVSEIALNISADNTESSVERIEYKKPGAVMVQAITLSTIIKKENLYDFSLVCDIEGSEIGIILLDKESLRQCKELFIELHDTEYEGKGYTPNEILNKLVTEHRFKLIDRHGPVCYLQK